MRDSIVFYQSWLEAVRCLPAEQQGNVLISILEYGLYGETSDVQEPITQAILTLVKPQIDTNNKRFENGKKGGRPKGVGDEDYVGENQTAPETKSDTTGNSRSCQGKTKEKPKVNQEITKEKPKNNQTETKVKPNVYVYDNDKEISTDVDIKKDASPPTSLESEISEMKNSEIWLDSLQTLHNITVDEIKTYMEEFLLQCKADGKTRHGSMQDAKSHFNNWLRLKLSKQKTDDAQTNRHDKRRGCSPADGGFSDTF